jgi:hypothetical protein
VWDVLTDLSAYGEWNPVVTISGRRARMRTKALRDYAPFEAALRERVESSMRP